MSYSLPKGGAKVVFAVFDENDNPIANQAGDFGGVDPSLTLAFPLPTSVRNIKAGIDLNNNGVFDSDGSDGPVVRQLQVQKSKVATIQLSLAQVTINKGASLPQNITATLLDTNGNPTRGPLRQSNLLTGITVFVSSANQTDYSIGISVAPNAVSGEYAVKLRSGDVLAEIMVTVP